MRMRNRLETRVARDGYRACPKDRNDTFRASRPDGVTLPKTPREAPGRAARKGSKTRRGTFSITGAEAFGKPGIPNGQEMILSDNPQPQQAKVASATLSLNGKALKLTAYEIAGNNYFKLRDLGEQLNFGIRWDAAANAIYIDTFIGYTQETEK